jgi:hypothetical protein
VLLRASQFVLALNLTAGHLPSTLEARLARRGQIARGLDPEFRQTAAKRYPNVSLEAEREMEAELAAEEAELARLL